MQERKKNRLGGYDYSLPGVYFVTVCVQNHEKLLGTRIVGDGFPVPPVQELSAKIILTPMGEITKQYIEGIPGQYPSVQVENYIVMPNHIHLLIGIVGKSVTDTSGTGNPSPTNVSLGSVMGWLKYQTTKNVNELRQLPGQRFWQRSFHDHIIRTRREYEKIWQYIETNPQNWQSDCFYTP